MNKLLTTIILLFSFVTVSSGANAQLFGPRDYDECILENMRGVTSNSAAASIRRSCLQKFPRPANGPLSAAELGKLNLTELSWEGGYQNRPGTRVIPL